MNISTRWPLVSWLLGSVFLGGVAQAAAPTDCDRACLRGLADKMLASMVAHDPASLPLSRVYAATENSTPAALGMMVIWRTVTAAKSRYYVIDPESQQVFMITTVAEGPNDTLLFGRLKIEQQLISEVELYTNRSRGQGGFQFDPDGPAHFPAAWTTPIGPKRRASRAQLLEAGRSIFDPSVPAPDVAPGCVIMENGKVVAENPDVLKHIGPTQQSSTKAADAKPSPSTNPDGTVSIPCGNPPERPADKLARTSIIDEEQGVVVSLGIVHGISEPYVITQPTESAFVPDSLLRPYVEMLKNQQASGKFTAPALRPMAASAVTAEVHRVYDGKLQGLHLLVNIGAPGFRSPWVGKVPEQTTGTP
jgi:hypothetical protein